MAFLRDSSVYCITNFTYPYPEKYIVGGICMLTSTVGFLGAALQIKSLWQYRNRQRRRPSPNPNIIFYLALSDLMACIGRYISYECSILYFLALLYILTKIIYACLELRIGCYCAMYTQNRSQSLVVQRSRLTSCQEKCTSLYIRYYIVVMELVWKLETDPHLLYLRPLV